MFVNVLFLKCFLNPIFYFVRQNLILLSYIYFWCCGVADFLLFLFGVGNHFLSFLVSSKEIVVEVTHDFLGVTGRGWSLCWFWPLNWVVGGVGISSFGTHASVGKILIRRPLAYVPLTAWPFWIGKGILKVSWIHSIVNHNTLCLTGWSKDIAIRSLWLNLFHLISDQNWRSVLVLFGSFGCHLFHFEIILSNEQETLRMFKFLISCSSATCRATFCDLLFGTFLVNDFIYVLLI